MFHPVSFFSHKHPDRRFDVTHTYYRQSSHGVWKEHSSSLTTQGSLCVFVCVYIILITSWFPSNVLLVKCSEVYKQRVLGGNRRWWSPSLQRGSAQRVHPKKTNVRGFEC